MNIVSQAVNHAVALFLMIVGLELSQGHHTVIAALSMILSIMLIVTFYVRAQVSGD